MAARFASLAISFAWLVAPASARPALDQVTFPELGEAYLEAHCPRVEGVAICELETVVTAGYASVHIGAFELSLPIEFLGDPKRGKEVRELAGALVDLQSVWVDWFCNNEGARQRALGGLEILSTWIDGWSASELRALKDGAGVNLYEALGAGEDVLTACADVREVVMTRGAMGIAPRHTEFIRLLGCPTRRDFMEMVGYAGLVDEAKKEELWFDGVEQWTQFWIDRTVVLALEYAPWSPHPKFEDGLSMRKFDKDGLRQQFVQQSARALLFTSFNRTDLALLEKGLAIELTLAVCGAANTIDGEGGITSSGGITAPYSKFVPGGNSSGGSLPPVPASALDSMMENHWRKGGGADHFLKPLRKGQKEGAKRAQKDRDNPLVKNKAAHFQLLGETGRKFAISAPFLGRVGAARQYPAADFLNDYREFYRSYQVCFLHWLSQDGVRGDPEASFAKYRELVVRMGSSSSLVLDDVVKTVYGNELGGPVPNDRSMEWRFLEWLRVGK
jgi:hypothetical protein